MKNEISILLSLDKTRMSSQREIAKAAGISLGNTNLTIKNLIEKGLIKKEQTKERNVCYDLTLEGEDKRDLIILDKINAAIKWLNCIGNSLDKILEENSVNLSNIVILYGEEDWLKKLITERLDSKNIKWNVILDFAEVKNPIDSHTKFFIWNPKFKREFEKYNVAFIYLLDFIK